MSTQVRHLPLRVALKNYLAVGSLVFLNGAAFANWVPRIPAIQHDLRLDNGQLGLATVGMAAGALATLPVGAALVGPVGSRASAVGAGVAYSFAIALPAMAGSLVGLTLALFAVGSATALFDVGINAQSIAVERAARRVVVPYFHAMFSLGSLAGAVSGATAAGLGILPLPHLLAAGALLAVVAVATTPALVPDRAPARTGGVRPRRRPALRLTRALVTLGFVAFFGLLAEGAVSDWSAVFLRQDFDASAGAAGGGFVAFSILMLAGAVSGPRVTDRFGPRRVVRASGYLIVAGSVAVGLAPSPAAAIAGFATLGAGVACVFPLVVSAAGHRTDAPVSSGSSRCPGSWSSPSRRRPSGRGLQAPRTRAGSASTATDDRLQLALQRLRHLLRLRLAEHVRVELLGHRE